MRANKETRNITITAFNTKKHTSNKGLYKVKKAFSIADSKLCYSLNSHFYD